MKTLQLVKGVSAFCMIGILAACSGDGTGSIYGQLSDEFDDLAAANASRAITPDQVLIGSTGTALYTGVARFRSGDGPLTDSTVEALSDVTVTANFADDSFNGRFENFRGRDTRASGYIEFDADFRDEGNNNSAQSTFTATRIEGLDVRVGDTYAAALNNVDALGGNASSLDGQFVGSQREGAVATFELGVFGSASDKFVGDFQTTTNSPAN